MHNIIFKINPLVIIAAISVIIFSLVGIAAITGQMTSVNSEISGSATSANKETGIKTNISPIFVENRAATYNTEQATPCANCAVVDSIIIKEVKGNGSRVGRVPGGVADDQNAATSTYLVKVRMDDGTYQVVSQQDQPAFQIGEKVKIVKGTIVRLEDPATKDKSHMFALFLAMFTGRVF
jgi:outer membrane lipoprotein SlyB